MASSLCVLVETSSIYFRTKAEDDYDPVVFALKFGDEIGKASVKNTGVTISEFLISEIESWAEALNNMNGQADE
jgi:hypothetical protein